MIDFPKNHIFVGGDTFQNHLNDSIGKTFKIGVFSYKVINIQKKQITFKNLSTGKNKVFEKR